MVAHRYNCDMNNTIFSDALLSIEADGYVVISQFLVIDMIKALHDFALFYHAQQLTYKANTGLGDAHRLISSEVMLRGDHIVWLEDTSTNNALQQYFSRMNLLRHALNQIFYLGLESLESHFSIYPAGTSYAKHLDQFQTKKTRKISSILYLNNGWKAEDGGELRLYLNNNEYVDIEPIGGRLVLFESERFFHEVLTTKRERVSITGWFKTRD